MPFIESPQEFTERQACESIRDEDGQILFANGAKIVRDSSFGGSTSMIEAPEDPDVLLRAQRRFLATKIGIEQKAYDSFQSEVTEHASQAAHYPASVPALPESAIDALKAGAKRLQHLRRQLAAIDQRLTDTPELRARLEHRGRDDAEARRRHQTLNRVLNIHQETFVSLDSIETDDVDPALYHSTTVIPPGH